MVRHTGENLIDEQCIAVAPVLSFQSADVNGIKFDTPEQDSLAADDNDSFSKQIFNEWSGTPAMAEIEPIAQPDRVTDDVWWGAPSRNR